MFLFALTLTQLATIPAHITLHELLHLSKETKEAFRDVFADSESFLTQVLAIPTNDNGNPCPQCNLVQRQVPPSPSLLRTYSSKIISMIELYTTVGILVLRVSRQSKSIRGLHSASSQGGFSTS